MGANGNEIKIDEGHRLLGELVGTHKGLVLSDANEANTRARVIDSILTRVLGWRDEDMQREERVSEDKQTTFADYLITTASTFVIVEAKKAGAAFVLPTRITSARLGGILSKGEIGDAIRQARDYCRKRSAQFAVVTNGSAWIVFPAMRTDGVSFEDTQARVFRNLEDINEKRFVEFWETLSRQRVIEGNLEIELLGLGKSEGGRRPLSLLKEPEYKLGRNSLYQFIELAVTKALTDEGLNSDPDALRYCYVESSERLKFDSRLKMYLSDIKPPLGRAAVRVKTRKSRAYLKDTIAASVSAPPRFLLLLGPVGAGKSTFLNFTRRVSATNVISGKILWLVIDFKKATERDDPRHFIYTNLLSLIEHDKEFQLGDWKQSILPSYTEAIDALARGPLFLVKQHDSTAFDKHVSDMIMAERERVEPYVDAIIRNALLQRPGFLIVDNVDQIEDEKVQNSIFSETQAAAQRMGLNVIMSLRDSTYIKRRNAPAFDAFQVESLYVDPPNVLPVLSRRFQYAKELLSGVPADLMLSNGMRLRTHDVGLFFEIVAQSLLAEDAGFMFNVLSGGDIRRALSLTREFLSSGHTTADIALHNYVSDKSFRFAIHEIFKGATLGHRKFFREEESLLPNIFSAKLGRSALELLKLRIIHFFVTQAQAASFEGYSAEEFVAELHKAGIAESDVEATICVLMDKKVLRTSDGAPYSLASRLLPTRLAGYMLNDLGKKFSYLEMCMLDAIIYDDVTWQRIVELTATIQRGRDPLDTIRPRIDRVRVFLKYLGILEEKWVVECHRRNLQEPLCDQMLANTFVPALEKDFERAKRSADNQRVHRQGFASSPNNESD
jgi:KAP-like P-loop domain-containing protein